MLILGMLCSNKTFYIQEKEIIFGVSLSYGNKSESMGEQEIPGKQYLGELPMPSYIWGPISQETNCKAIHWSSPQKKFTEPLQIESH